MNQFKDRLNEALAENKLSQNAFAQKISMSQSIINNYCTGKREPSLNVLIIICKELNVSADYLLGLSDY
ncbi:MAG: helix-turn-helix transcriptional regulator [Clostridia bacterium]|nr:helix-turn-helix transcriptional regulator [Clostridia bacterium]